MRTVIFHDFLIERGGGEKVIDVLSKFLKAPIVTWYYNDITTYEELKKRKIFYHKLCLNKIAAKFRLLKLSRTSIFFREQLSKNSTFFNKNFDLAIFSGFYSIYLAKYLHIPKIYYIQAEPIKLVFERQAYSGKFFEIYNFFYKFLLEKWEKEGILSMDKLIANSYYIKRIYENLFGVHTTVIYPPVDVSKFYFEKIGDFFLSVGRLYPHKRIHIIANTFTRMPHKKLVIVGTGPLNVYLKKLSRKFSNIIFLGKVSERKLRELYACCKAVIYIPEKEHFGMVPIEANASGKPVIISKEGGLLETLRSKTGIAITPPYDKNLQRVIEAFDNYNFSTKKCIQNARRFDQNKEFLPKMKKIIQRCLK